MIKRRYKVDPELLHLPRIHQGLDISMNLPQNMRVKAFWEQERRSYLTFLKYRISK